MKKKRPDGVIAYQPHLPCSQRGRSPRRQAEAPPPRITPLKPTPVYDTYWRFAAERQRVFFRRLEGLPPPWTDDPILCSTSSPTPTAPPTGSAST